MAFSLKKSGEKKEQQGKAVSPRAKAAAARDTSKPKRMNTSPGNKYSLIIGDEGAILVYITGRVVKARHFFADAGEKNLRDLQGLLSQDKKAPLLVIIDSMDQSFVQQTLPPISSLGVNKLIQKRLERDLPPDAIKGALLLDREKSGRRDWNFLMVSLDKTPHITTWLDFIDNVDNRVKGIYLASIETELLIKQLDRGMGRPKAEARATWKFFVSHNKVGGFRQVVLKNGRIIFTRLGQPVGETTPDVIAGNIEQEVVSTIEYMKRLGFSPQEGLDLYVIASADINAKLDISRFSAKHVYKFTPFEISEFVGIEGATQPSDQFGDVILAATIGCSRSHVLTLSTPLARKVNQVYDFIVYERAAAGLALLGMLIYGGMLAFNAGFNYSQTADLQQKKTLQQRKLDQLQADIKMDAADIKKVNETVALYDMISKENTTPLPVLSKIRSVILSPVLIRYVVWNGGDVPAEGAPPAAGETIEMVLRFPEVSGTDEAFTSVARKILKDLRAEFPDYKVVYTKLPEALVKKSAPDTITLDEKAEKSVDIAKSQLEATLMMTRQAGGAPAASAVPGTMPGMSTDALIGLGGGGLP